LFKLRNEALVRGLLLAGLTVVLVGCGGGGGGDGGVPGGPGSGGSTSGGGGSGGGTTVTEPKLSLALQDLDSGATSTTLSFEQNLKATATVLDEDGKPVANAIVSFSTSPDSLAAMVPDIGTALTDADGKASIQLSPKSLTAAGAGKLTATAEVGDAAVTGSASFSVTRPDVGLDRMSVSPNPISAYGTASVSVDVTGVAETVPVTVNFASSCSAQGKANLTSSALSVSGMAVANYEDKGCAATDKITASVAGTSVSRSVALDVAEPGIASIQFVSATPENILIKGTGAVGNHESIVRFKVVDDNGEPIDNIAVTLGLSTDAGGILLDSTAVGTGDSLSKTTDENGLVAVSVVAGTVPTPVWVTATARDGAGKVLVTQSVKLTISTGRAAQDRMSLGVGSHNVEAFQIDNVIVPVTARLSDRVGNPVPDGTVVNFVTSIGQIGASCQTEDGVCEVSYRSSGARLNGRAVILAYALGEESFQDMNGNNIYDLSGSEPFTDLGQVFVDANENGTIDNGEQYFAYGSGSRDCGVPMSTSPQVPNVDGTCDQKWGPAYVRQHNLIVLSGPHADVNPKSFSMKGQCTYTFDFKLFDQNNNPMPEESRIEAIIEGTEFTSAKVSPDAVPDTAALGGTSHLLTLKRKETTGCNDVLARTLPLEITTPGGHVTSINLTITQ